MRGKSELADRRLPRRAGIPERVSIVPGVGPDGRYGCTRGCRREFRIEVTPQLPQAVGALDVVGAPSGGHDFVR